MKEIEYSIGKWGKRAIIHAEWQESFLERLLKEEISEIELNRSKGWKGSDVNFLRSLQHLEGLVLLDASLATVEPIHELNNLRTLSLSTFSKTSINFLSFPKLTACDFEWRRGSESLFRCSRLTSLAINNFKLPNCDLFSNLPNLENLTLLNSSLENLGGVFKLDKLKYLSISNLNKLFGLPGIRNLRNLEELEIQRCKRIHSVNEIFELNNLRRLLLIDTGEIESIHGLENLRELKEFLFYESTNIVDGDLSPITRLPNITNISFQNRRHYSHKREDFGELYFGK